MDFLRYEAMLHWAAVSLYVLAAVCFSVMAVFEKPRFWKAGAAFSASGLLPHAAAIALRWWATGHGPYMVRYEVLSSIAWVCVAMFLYASRRFGSMRFTGMVVMPYAFLSMAYGFFASLEVKKMPPSFSSIWLLLHVSFYKLAVGAVLLSFAAAVFYLVKETAGSRGFLKNLPDTGVLDYFSHRFAAFGFTFWSIGVIAGAIWANQSWGRYWGWDPIETWSFITWLFYGIYLHLYFFFGLRGRKAALMIIGCFILSLITAFFMPFVSKSIHSSYFT